MFSRASITSLIRWLCKNIKVIPCSKTNAPLHPRMGQPRGKRAELMVRNTGTSPKYKPAQEDNRGPSIPIPNTTVEQPELLQINHKAGLVSMGCYSITFPNGLEGMCTINIHPFQIVCSNIPLTTRTSASPSAEQNNLSMVVFPNDLRRKQRWEAEAQVAVMQMFHGKKGQRTENRIKHSRPDWL